MAIPETFSTLRMVEHLLPRSKTWSLGKMKTLRNWIIGLAGSVLFDVLLKADARFADMFPDDTTQLDDWEDQFGLPMSGGLTEAARRIRLDSTWKEAGGQALLYLQGVLQANGFNVFLHPWWEPVLNDDALDPVGQVASPLHDGDVDVSNFGDAPPTPADTSFRYGTTLGTTTSVVFLRFELDIPKDAKILRVALELTPLSIGSGVRTVNIGELVKDGRWDIQGYGPTAYPLGSNFPLPTGFIPPSEDIVPGVLVGDDWLHTWVQDKAFDVIDTPWLVGSGLYDPRFATDGIRDAVQRVIDEISYVQADPTGANNCIGLVIDSPEAGGGLPSFDFHSSNAASMGPRLLIEWQEKSVQPLTVKNPNTYLIDGGPVSATSCGEALMECGEATALLGETIGASGVLLVNKIDTATTIFLGCDDPLMECDESVALCGEGLGVTFGRVPYLIPSDVEEWPFILYVGGEIWPMHTSVDTSRQEEFENLLLRICPGQQWLGLLINFS